MFLKSLIGLTSFFITTFKVSRNGKRRQYSCTKIIVIVYILSCKTWDNLTLINEYKNGQLSVAADIDLMRENREPR